MKVFELIEKLKAFDPDLVVCADEWSEPRFVLVEVGEVFLAEGKYKVLKRRGLVEGKHVRLSS